MPPTAEYLLRLEGVNLGHFVLDTNDLSTIRGGSLLLLHAPRRVKQQFAGRLEAISLGASSGVFRFEVPADDQKAISAEQIRQEVESFLAKDELEHATFVVDVCPTSGDFRRDLETVTALNRFRQMRSPSLVFPASRHAGAPVRLRDVCQIDLVRPIGGSMRAPKGEGDEKGRLWVSSSVETRRLYGQEQKQSFYADELGDGVSRRFTLDFGELAADKDESLHHKMAVIYLDGNRFGLLKSRLCTTADAQKEFDRTLRSYRKKALQNLLERADAFQGWHASESGEPRCRLETLLWGGDELIWVVPAWKGWETLAGFYAVSKNWAFRDESLTHAGGLVFCSHKAPIHRIRALAENLAGLAKKRSREENLFAYQVLETYDDVGVSLEKYRQDRWPDFEAADNLILDGGAMNRATGLMSTIKATIPRRKLQRLAQASLAPSGQRKEAERLDRILEGILKRTSEPASQALAEAFGSGPGRWLHLADLWDYLPEGEG